MRSVIALVSAVVGVTAFAQAQEGERKKEGKKEPSVGLKEVDLNGDGRASLTEIRIAIAKLTSQKDGRKEKENRERRRDGDGREKKDGKGAQEPSIALKDLDTNGDGRAQLSELQAALESLTAKRDGDKKEGDEKRK